MAEEEGAEWEVAGTAAPGADSDADAEIAGDSAAMSLALRSASRAEVDAFLRDQRALITDQRHYLRERYKRLVEQVEETALRLWELRLGIMLRVGTLVVGVVVASGIGVLMWEAGHSHGLVIERFAVPPDLAVKGLSGEVVAAKIQDELTALQEATDSSRAPQSYANNWGEDIKVEIPETGVSIGELRRFLREWLGHDTRISGELYHTVSGVAVTARSQGGRGATISGAEADFDTLIRKAAEQVYGQTQPYRYANYLDRNHVPEGREQRVAQATAIYRKLIAGSDMRERAWAWFGLGSQLANMKDNNRDSAGYLRKAVTAWPDLTVAYYSLAGREWFLERGEAALSDSRNTARLLKRESSPDVSADAIVFGRVINDARIAFLTADYSEAARQFAVGAEIPNQPYGWHGGNFFQWWRLFSLARAHDGGAVRAYMREQGLDKIAYNPRAISGFVLYVHAGLKNWPAIVALETPSLGAMDHWRAQYPALIATMATAKAEMGDLKGAQTLIASGPADCDSCLVARGFIAEKMHQPARADWWFARAETQAPSLPFADTAWGEALLARGKPDLAIEKFTLADRKSPRFGDPLELWGEALMAKNQSHLALAKFAEAEKYAPNWGRLHLKWGEALAWVGKPDEAKAHFARAEALDLTLSEKSELARRR